MKFLIFENFRFFRVSRSFTGFKKFFKNFMASLSSSGINYALRFWLSYLQEPQNFERALLFGFWACHLPTMWSPWPLVAEILLLKFLEYNTYCMTSSLVGLLHGAGLSWNIWKVPRHLWLIPGGRWEVELQTDHNGNNNDPPGPPPPPEVPLVEPPPTPPRPSTVEPTNPVTQPQQTHRPSQRPSAPKIRNNLQNARHQRFALDLEDLDDEPLQIFRIKKVVPRTT